MSICPQCGNFGCKLPPYECLAESYWEVVKELDQLVDENDYMKRELTARGLGWVVKAAERER